MIGYLPSATPYGPVKFLGKIFVRFSTNLAILSNASVGYVFFMINIMIMSNYLN